MKAIALEKLQLDFESEKQLQNMRARSQEEAQ
jgi:hypothetical protein